MRAFAFSFILIVFAVSAHGQYTSAPEGIFSTNEVRGCAPFTIVLDVPTCDGSIGCEKKFDQAFPSNSSIEQANLASRTHTYTEAGVYTISVYRGDASHTDLLTITVYENIPPEVEVSNCGSNQISLRIPDTNYDQYVVTYDAGTPASSTLISGGSEQHDFGSAGNHQVSVQGRHNQALHNCQSTVINLDVTSINTPTITRLEALDNSSIRLDYDTQPFVQYRLEIKQNNNANFQQVKTFFDEVVDTISNVRPDESFYCFRLSAINTCTGAPVPSNIICSAKTDLTILNNENRLTWNTNTQAALAFSVSKNVSSGSFDITLPNANPPFVDTDIFCGTEYCYRFNMHYAANGFNDIQSISLPKCGVAISTDVPAAISNITSVTLEQGVDLQWEEPTDYTPDIFTIFKSSGGGFRPLDTTNVYQFTDPTFSRESGSCYRLSYIDICGNKSPESPEACPLVLTGSLVENNHISLTWSPYNGYANGVDHYVVEKYTQNGTLLQSIDVSTTSWLDEEENLDEQVYHYYVKAVPTGTTLPPSVSNLLIVIKDPNLIYPRAFTPNQDDLNDIFSVYGHYIASFELDIYNRWGELMFTTTEMSQGWDGTYKGNAMPEGTYTFVAHIVDDAGRNHKRSGTLVLLRKK